MADGMEFKRIGRPSTPPPRRDASLEEREAWSEPFVAWYIALTGGEIESPDKAPSGHRWRLEYFSCVQDPEAYARSIDEELKGSHHE